MDHQTPTTLLIFSTLSLGGCGGHPTRPRLNLKDKSQMSTPDEYTDNFKSNLICIVPSVRAKLKKPLCPRTQCKRFLIDLLEEFLPIHTFFQNTKESTICALYSIIIYLWYFSTLTTYY